MNGNYFVHPSSIVDEGASIGAGTKIWHFCHIMPRAKIGKNCIIGQNCFIDNGTVTGDRVKIQNNVSVYNGVIIENEVFIGPSVVFTNVINPRSFIDRKNEFRQTLLKKGSSIGANATVICGITVGEFAMVGAGAVITKDVLPYSLVTGNPAEFSGWISQAGYRLHFNSDNTAVCGGSKQAYVINGNIITKL